VRRNQLRSKSGRAYAGTITWNSGRRGGMEVWRRVYLNNSNFHHCVLAVGLREMLRALWSASYKVEAPPAAARWCLKKI